MDRFPRIYNKSILTKPTRTGESTFAQLCFRPF